MLEQRWTLFHLTPEVVRILYVFLMSVMNLWYHIDPKRPLRNLT